MTANSKTLQTLMLGAAAGCLLVVLPLAGQPQLLATAKPWILVIIGIAASLLQPAFNPVAILKSPGDQWTGAQIIWTVYLTQLAAVLEAGYWRFPASADWGTPALAALGLAICGLVLRTWAVRTLGNYFTMHVAVGGEQQVVSSGPFATIRHPSYLGALMLYLGTAMFMGAWLASLFTAILLPLAFVRRINVEEAMLAAKLGPPYLSYRHKVKARLFPGVW